MSIKKSIITLIAFSSVCTATLSADATADKDALAVGEKAPDFSVTAYNGKDIKLKSFHGKTCVVLYFYPKDETPGCTKEACAFRDSYSHLKETGAEVIGVSGDSREAHELFAKNHELPFILVADNDNKLLELYHVPKLKGTLHARYTFVIDKKGVIRAVYKDLPNADDHAKQALTMVESLQKTK